MLDIFIETSPFQPPDKDGFSIGIIHKERDCPSSVAWVVPAYDDRHPNYYAFKIGKGAWLKVKKTEPKCPDCFDTDTMEEECI